MKLLNSFGPNPRLVRMFLLEKGMELPSEDLDLLGGANRAEPYLSKNPGGQMPALELDAERSKAFWDDVRALKMFQGRTNPLWRISTKPTSGAASRARTSTDIESSSCGQNVLLCSITFPWEQPTKS